MKVQISADHNGEGVRDQDWIGNEGKMKPIMVMRVQIESIMIMKVWMV